MHSRRAGGAGDGCGQRGAEQSASDLTCMHLWPQVRERVSAWADLGAPEEVLDMISYGVRPRLVSYCAPYDEGSLQLHGEQLAAWHVLRDKYLRLGAIVNEGRQHTLGE